ncbi:MAG: transcription factor S [Candidatus Woesearchaeota archaeon]
MIIIFCPKCSAILVPKKVGKKTKMVCSCGYKEKNKISLVMKEDVVEKKEDRIEVVDKRVETLPKTKEACPKCKNPEAYYSLLQTRSADEAATRFFRCTKCGHTWRVY